MSDLSDVINLDTIAELKRLACKLPMPKIYPPLLVSGDYGAVAVYDRKGTLVLAMRESDWDRMIEEQGRG